MGCSTEFLKTERNRLLANGWMLKYDNDRDFPFIRFWSEDTVQIDGDLSLVQIKELVEIMERFE